MTQYEQEPGNSGKENQHRAGCDDIVEQTEKDIKTFPGYFYFFSFVRTQYQLILFFYKSRIFILFSHS